MNNQHNQYPRWELKLWQPFSKKLIVDALAQGNRPRVRSLDGDEPVVYADNADFLAYEPDAKWLGRALYVAGLSDNIDNVGDVDIDEQGAMYGYYHKSTAVAVETQATQVSYNPKVCLDITFSHYGIDMNDYQLPFDLSEVESYAFKVENQEPTEDDSYLLTGIIEVYTDLMTAIVIIQRNKAINSENHFSIHDII